MNWAIIDCCLHETTTICQEHMIAMYQLMVPVLGSATIYVLVLVFFDAPSHTDGNRAFRIAVGFMVFDLLVVVLAATGATIVLFFHAGVFASSTRLYGRLLGAVAVTLTAVQWTPQIFKTFMSRSVGVLSIWMLLIQCPGNFILVGYQLFGAATDFTTWAPYAASGLEQFILILLYLYFRFYGVRPVDTDATAEQQKTVVSAHRYHRLGEPGSEPDEDSSLLDSEAHLGSEELGHAAAADDSVLVASELPPDDEQQSLRSVVGEARK